MSVPYVSQVVNALRSNEARIATKYLSEKEVVRATIRRYRGRVSYKGNLDIILKVGRPNFKERKFIKLCKKAGVSFPVQKIQLSFPKT